MIINYKKETSKHKCILRSGLFGSPSVFSTVICSACLSTRSIDITCTFLPYTIRFLFHFSLLSSIIPHLFLLPVLISLLFISLCLSSSLSFSFSYVLSSILFSSDLTFHFFSAECLPTTSSHRLRYFFSE